MTEFYGTVVRAMVRGAVRPTVRPMVRPIVWTARRWRPRTSYIVAVTSNNPYPVLGGTTRTRRIAYSIIKSRSWQVLGLKYPGFVYTAVEGVVDQGVMSCATKGRCHARRCGGFADQTSDSGLLVILFSCDFRELGDALEWSKVCSRVQVFRGTTRQWRNNRQLGEWILANVP